LSRRIVLLNLALLALLAVLGWQLRVHWLSARAGERLILEQTLQPRGVFAPPLPPAAKPFAAVDYLEIAQKTLFSKDRNPTVVIDVPAPKPAPPEPPMPPLPNFHGMMAMFGDSVIILSVGRDSTQKSYRAGDDVGPFKLVSFDRENVKLEWKGKTIDTSPERLLAKDEPPPNPSAAQRQTQQPAAVAPQVTSLSPAPGAVSLDSSSNSNKAPALGVDMGGGYRACATGDTSPAGTVVNGFRKVVATTLMGNSCHWELVK
jgi:hypothetical protein